MVMRHSCDMRQLYKRCPARRSACSLRMVLLAIAVSIPVSLAAHEGDSLLGKWCTEKCEAVFDFYVDGNEYSARLYPKKYPDIIDSLNPVDSLKSRKLAGKTTIYGLVYNAAKKQWENGRVYNPSDGKTYKCNCRLRDGDLVFRGYLGISLLGQSQIWIRAAKNP